MTPVGLQPATALPDDPIRAALDDPDTRTELMRHACARLGALLAERSVIARSQLAEDAVQDAMKRAWEKRASFNPTQGSAAGWLHGILERVLHECSRTSRKQPIQPTADPAGWDALAAHLTTDDNVLIALLAALPEEQRAIVVRHHLDEMSHEQISVELGISPGHSRVRLARAIAALRELATRGGGR